MTHVGKLSPGRDGKPRLRVAEPPDERQMLLNDAFGDYCEARGVDPEAAIANGIHPAWDSDERAQTITTVSRHAKKRADENLPPLPGFIVDYGDGYYTFRYLCDEADYPTDVNTNKSAKMPSPSGKGSRPFLPKLMRTKKHPPGTKVRICEAAVKALVLCLLGIPAIGLNGVYTWSKDKRISDELLKLFRQNEWVPIICFDSNAHSGPSYNDQVGKAQRSFVRALYEAGDFDDVFIDTVPPFRRRDQGIDDYLARGFSFGDITTYRVETDGSPALVILSARDIYVEVHEAKVPIFTGYINRVESNLLLSAAKQGKTRLAITMALAASAGKNLFNHPDHPSVPTKTVLVVLEDERGDLQANLANFAKSMGITWPNNNLVVVREFPEGSLFEDKLDQIRKAHPDLGFAILDNYTKLEMIAGLPDNMRVPLVQREYQKRSKYTDYARQSRLGILLLEHAKKGAGSTRTIADKGNSTGTAGAALDNLASLQWDKDMPSTQRLFYTEARTHRQIDIVLDMPTDGAVTYVCDSWDVDLSDIQSGYVVAIYQLTDSGAEGKRTTADAIRERCGTNATPKTVTNAMVVLNDKGWINSTAGAGGGYWLTPRALGAMRRRVTAKY